MGMERQLLIEGDLKQSGGIVVRKSVTLQDAAGEGAIGTVAVFTVSGRCRVRISAYCATDLTGASATIELGVAGGTALLIAQTTATDLDAGEFWSDATPAIVEGAQGFMNAALPIIITVATAAVTAGVIEFTCEYEPISDGAEVVAA